VKDSGAGTRLTLQVYHWGLWAGSLQTDLIRTAVLPEDAELMALNIKYPCCWIIFNLEVYRN
jgi:hypothetical protein